MHSACYVGANGEAGEKPERVKDLAGGTGPRGAAHVAESSAKPCLRQHRNGRVTASEVDGGDRRQKEA